MLSIHRKKQYKALKVKSLYNLIELERTAKSVISEIPNLWAARSNRVGDTKNYKGLQDTDCNLF